MHGHLPDVAESSDNCPSDSYSSIPDYLLTSAQRSDFVFANLHIIEV